MSVLTITGRGKVKMTVVGEYTDPWTGLNFQQFAITPVKEGLK